MYSLEELKNKIVDAFELDNKSKLSLKEIIQVAINKYHIYLKLEITANIDIDLFLETATSLQMDNSCIVFVEIKPSIKDKKFAYLEAIFKIEKEIL
jgi:hypothetical protein